MNIKIREIDIKAFRAYKDVQKFDFMHKTSGNVADLVAIYAPNGYGKTSFFDAVEWAMKVDKLGAGEILLTSMDCDGVKQGYDIELTKIIAENVSVPVIASGGAGTMEHFYDALTEGADAALAASLFHYKELEISQVKDYLADRGISVRK